MGLSIDFGFQMTLAAGLIYAAIHIWMLHKRVERLERKLRIK